jgi:integrase/recombinase XerD
VGRHNVSCHEKKTTHSRQSTCEWYQDYLRFVQLKGLSGRSIKTYLGWASQLADHYSGEQLPELQPRQVLDFLLHLQSGRGLSGATLSQAVCALRTFYRDHLDKRWKIWAKIRIQREEPLPHILTRGEVAKLLGTFRDNRYRAYFTLVYHCGLRMSEAIHISPKDIDGERNILRVKHAKGGKPREVPISPALIKRLRKFWKWHRNPKWLFPACGRGKKNRKTTLQQALAQSTSPMASATIQAAMRIARAESGLMKQHEKISTHTLRHSYATHMLEAGTSVRQIAAYLGHTTLKPTMVYLHLTEISEEKARAALATLPGV